MTQVARRSKFWFVVASVFTLINLAGAPLAIADGEWLHAAAHVGLLIVGAYFVWRLAPDRWRQPQGQQQTGALPAERLKNLQHSVDAIALEVERISEAQRFIAKRIAERVESHSRKLPP